mgnify:CR=1 FL=1
MLLTDGAAFRGNSGNVQSKTRNKIGKRGACYRNNSSFKKTADSANSYNGDERCIVDLVEFLNNILFEYSFHMDSVVIIIFLRFYEK